MKALNKQALRDNAESTIGILENIAGFEPSDIDGDIVELRFENEGGFDTGCDVSIVDQCQKTADVIRALLDELEKTQAQSSKWCEAFHKAVSVGARYEERIAELEVFILQSCYVFDGRDADISDSYIDASTSSLMPKVSTKNEGELCRYCSDGSYSGLPGGACEHCMGTGLDNPAAGIGVKGE
jgi:hypothetical protein|uniref:ead/Ea22-like family protein n=1 Tax=Citrobacter freundii TaxID=546 RepID=UPI001FF0CC0C|nr:ead/Ea22-like family protein [Citrobacter freundii]